MLTNFNTREMPRALQNMLERDQGPATASPPRRAFLKMAGLSGLALGTFPGLALAQGGAEAALKPTEQPLEWRHASLTPVWRSARSPRTDTPTR